MLSARFMLVLGLAVVVLIGLGYFFYGLQPTLAKDAEIEFEIDKGESFREIGARLSQKSLIKSISVFKLYSFLAGEATEFRPGVYDLNYKMSVPEIVGVISAGGANEVRVTILEGATVADVEQILQEKGVVKEGDIKNCSMSALSKDFPFLENVNSLEGFLFPDTYRFDLDSGPEQVIRTMLSNFEEQAWTTLKNRENWYGDLILASYLEKEIPKYKDRRIVAGILLKRLGSGIPLQVDATISYAKCERRFITCDGSKAKVTKKSVENVSSPYNTYKRTGWTPTPISNPGKEAIKAAINPKPTPYWYYLSAEDSGETIFSETLEEHNINKSKHL